MKNIIFATCGISGSGKTHFSRKFAEINNIKRFSSDENRALFGTDESDQSVSRRSFEKIYSDVLNCLKNGKNCIVDSTNYNMKNRANLVKIAKENNAKLVFFVFDTHNKNCNTNNKKRVRVVPDYVIENQSLKFTCPITKDTEITPKESDLNIVILFEKGVTEDEMKNIYKNVVLEFEEHE
jgi:predicted kinase